MKFCISSAVVVAILLVPTVAFGEIIYGSDSDGAGSTAGTCASVYAGAYNPEDSVWGTGQQYYTTTEGDEFFWYYEIYANTEVVVTRIVGPCWAWASADAIGADQKDGNQAKSAYSYLADTGLAQDEPGTLYKPDDGWVDAWCLIVGAAHSASAEASVVGGNPDTAYAMVEASAWCAAWQ